MPVVTFNDQDGGVHRTTLELASGGTVTVTGRFDAFTLSLDDRAFIFALADLLQQYPSRQASPVIQVACTETVSTAIAEAAANLKSVVADVRLSPAPTRRSRPLARPSTARDETKPPCPETPTSTSLASTRPGLGRGQIDWQAVAYRALSPTEPRTVPEIRRHAIYGAAVSVKHAQMRLRRACLALARQGRAIEAGQAAWLRAPRPERPREDADLEVTWSGGPLLSHEGGMGSSLKALATCAE